MAGPKLCTVQLRSLATWIESHGMRAEVRDGVVWGECAWSTETETGRTWEAVGTTLGEVRSWLGY